MPENPATPIKRLCLEVWTAEDEAVYRPLRRKKLRIEARIRRDRNRKRRFSPRLQSIAKGEVSR